MKKWFLPCLILPLFFMSSLKGEELLQSASLSISKHLDEAKKKPKANLLEEDEFYSEILPKILGDDFVPGGEYKTPFFTQLSHLHPFSNDPFIISLHDLCSGSLSQTKVGHYETMAPFLAESIFEEEKGTQLHYHVTLKENLFWHELSFEKKEYQNLNLEHFKKRPVTSHDFKFFVQVFKNLHVHMPKAVSLRDVYQSLKEIKVINDREFIVIWDIEKGKPYNIKYLTGQLKPLARHIYECWPDGSSMVSQESSVEDYLFAQHFTNHWASKKIPSCGPWVFESSTPHEIILSRNSDFPSEYASLIERLHFIYKSSPISAWQAFKNKELTSCYLSQSQMKDYNHFLQSAHYKKQEKEGLKVDKLNFLSNVYYFIAWNQINPIFESKKVRKALSYAVNTKELIDHFLNGEAQAVTGPFLPTSKSYNQEVSPYGYNPQLAKEILEKNGWKYNSKSGFREKKEEGKTLALRFHLSYFMRNEEAQKICEYLANSFKEIGVECLLQGLSYSEFMNRYTHKNFDALYMGWALSPPPENLKPIWHSSHKDREGSSNIIHFQDAEVDRIIEELAYCADKTNRVKLNQSLHQRLHELAPYTFLFVPKRYFVYRNELKNVLIPQDSPLFSQANVSEICPKIFYLSEK